MNIQSFAEHVYSQIDKIFETEANKLLIDARQAGGNERYIAGKMDGISDTVKKIKEVYNLFVKEEKEQDEDESRPLY